jgi:hypothetical protein
MQFGPLSMTIEMNIRVIKIIVTQLYDVDSIRREFFIQKFCHFVRNNISSRIVSGIWIRFLKETSQQIEEMGLFSSRAMR